MKRFKSNYRLHKYPIRTAAAYSLVDEVEAAIENAFPVRRVLKSFLQKEHPLPYYRIYVRNYIIFYVISEDTMEVRRIYMAVDLETPVCLLLYVVVTSYTAQVI